MRSNINFILDIIDDNKVADKILSDFFNVKIKSNNLILKKIQLKTHLLENNTKQVTKKYQKKATTPLDIVLLECAIEELKNKTKEELMSYFSTKEGMNVPNFYKICTIMYASLDFIKENIEIISKNIKENKFLFKGLYNEAINEKNNIEVVEDIEELNRLIQQLRQNIDKLESNNKKIYKDNQKLEREIVKLTRECKKNENRLKSYESKIITYIEEKETLNKEIVKIKIENKERENENNLLSKEIVMLKNKNIELEKELKENELNIDEFQNGYKLAFIHQYNFNVCKKIFNDVLFIKYKDITKKYDSFVQNLKKHNINNVIMQTNKISTFDIMKLESDLKKENINMDIGILHNDRCAIEFITKNLDR